MSGGSEPTKGLVIMSMLLACLSVPAQAQYTYKSWIPVQVRCADGPGTTKEICPLVRDVIRGDIDFRLRTYYERYFLEIHAIKMGKNLRIAVSISFTDPEYEPFSEVFPYHIYSVPMVAPKAQASSVAEEIVDIHMHKAVQRLLAYYDE